MKNIIINTQNQNDTQNQNVNDTQKAYTNVTRLNVGQSLSHQKIVKVHKVVIEEVEDVVDKTIPEMWDDVVREIGGRRITRFSAMFGFYRYPIGGVKGSRKLCMMLEDTDCTLLKATPHK